MDYPDEFKTKADIQANQRRQRWARDALKPASPDATPDEITGEMLLTGGSFAKQLALLWRGADEINRRVIAESWPGLFAEYATAVHYRKLAIEAEGAFIEA